MLKRLIFDFMVCTDFEAEIKHPEEGLVWYTMEDIISFYELVAHIESQVKENIWLKS